MSEGEPSHSAPASGSGVAANPFVQQVKKLLADLDSDLQLQKFKPLNDIADKTKVPRIYIVLVVAVILLALIANFIGLSFLSNLFAFFPCFHSFQALHRGAKDAEEFCLTYWVVYGSLTLFESLLDDAFFWLPFYFVLKIVLMVWAYHPNSRGAMTIYNVLLKPIFVKAEAEVEEIEKEVEEIEEQHQHRGSSSQPPGGAAPHSD